MTTLHVFYDEVINLEKTMRNFKNVTVSLCAFLQTQLIASFCNAHIFARVARRSQKTMPRVIRQRREEGAV